MWCCGCGVSVVVWCSVVGVAKAVVLTRKYPSSFPTMRCRKQLSLK